MASGAVPPLLLVMDVTSSEAPISHCYQQQIHSHQQIGQRQVLDVQRVDGIRFFHQESTKKNQKIAYAGQDRHQPHTETSEEMLA